VLTPKLSQPQQPLKALQTPAAVVPQTPQQQSLVKSSNATAPFQKMPVSSPVVASKRSMLEMMFDSLNGGLIAMKTGSLEKMASSQLVPSELVMAPKIFISNWIDYSNKYGLGYQLTNGGVGVHFNDSTTIIMSANYKYGNPLKCIVNAN
jgi:hypothetical protein